MPTLNRNTKVVGGKGGRKGGGGGCLDPVSRKIKRAFHNSRNKISISGFKEKKEKVFL